MSLFPTPLSTRLHTSSPTECARREQRWRAKQAFRIDKGNMRMRSKPRFMRACQDDQVHVAPLLVGVLTELTTWTGAVCGVRCKACVRFCFAYVWWLRMCTNSSSSGTSQQLGHVNTGGGGGGAGAGLVAAWMPQTGQTVVHRCVKPDRNDFVRDPSAVRWRYQKNLLLPSARIQCCH